jgi:hypothetical protein
LGYSVILFVDRVVSSHFGDGHGHGHGGHSHGNAENSNEVKEHSHSHEGKKHHKKRHLHINGHCVEHHTRKVGNLENIGGGPRTPSMFSEKTGLSK